MIIEKMLEYLMLEKMLYDYEGNRSETAELFIENNTLNNMVSRRIELEDEFINEYKLPLQ